MKKKSIKNSTKCGSKA